MFFLKKPSLVLLVKEHLKNYQSLSIHLNDGFVISLLIMKTEPVPFLNIAQI